MTIEEIKQYFEDRNYECGPQNFPMECTCRYGVKWTDEWTGTYGELWRAWDLMKRCCCWVCHNHDCKEPRNEVIKDCGNSCELWSRTHYCENKNIKKVTEKDKLEERIKEYKSILNDLYEEVQTYEEWLQEAEEELNKLNKNG